MVREGRGHAWRGQLAHCWLQKRRAKNPHASFLVMVITLLEAVYGCEVDSAHICTHHNATADTRSSAEDEKAKALAAEKVPEA
eukprot:8181066-Pyramimonas_sp.AAC.1